MLSPTVALIIPRIHWQDNWIEILIALLIMSVTIKHMAFEFINNAEVRQD